MFSIIEIDDSDIIRKRVKEQLNEIDDVNVIGEVKNGRDAIPIIIGCKPDAVILDIHMPQKNGFEIVKELQMFEIETTIIIFTSFPNPHYRKIFKQLNVNYFFDKTNEFNEMIDLIQELSTKKKEMKNLEYRTQM